MMKLNIKISVEDIKHIDEVNESNSFYCLKVDPDNIKINPGKIDKIAGSGIKAVLQPGGSVRDDEVISACNEHGIAMVFTGQRCFKH